MIPTKGTTSETAQNVMAAILSNGEIIITLPSPCKLILVIRQTIVVPMKKSIHGFTVVD